MPSYKVEQVTAAPLNVLGEGPHWDVERQSLYYNDIYGGTIHRYDHKEDKAYSASIGKEFYSSLDSNNICRFKQRANQ